MFPVAPRCGHDLEIIAATVDRIQIARYLKHTGMPARGPGLKWESFVKNGTELEANQGCLLGKILSKYQNRSNTLPLKQ